MKDILKVRMLKTTPGYPDGVTRVTYLAGKVYDIPGKLADAFVNQIKCAELEVAVDTEEKAQKKQADMEAEADKQAELARKEIAEQERRDEIKRKKAEEKAKKKAEEAENKKAKEVENK